MRALSQRIFHLVSHKVRPITIRPARAILPSGQRCAGRQKMISGREQQQW